MGCHVFRPGNFAFNLILPTASMKIRLLSLTLICALVTMPALRAEDDATKKMAPKEDQTELGAKMEKISGAYRKLGRQIADATKNEDSLAQVVIIRDNAEAALKLEPAKKADLPADQQAKFVADYQTQMKKFIADAGKLADALKAGNNEEAAKVLQSLKTDQDDGHKDFRKKKAKKM